jgi:hypothetical protein
MEMIQNFINTYSTTFISSIALLLFFNELIRLYFHREISLFVLLQPPSLTKSFVQRARETGFSQMASLAIGTYILINAIGLLFLLFMLYDQNWIGATIYAGTKLLTSYAVKHEISGTYIIDKSGFIIPNQFMLLIFSMMRTYILLGYMPN